MAKVCTAILVRPKRRPKAPIICSLCNSFMCTEDELHKVHYCRFCGASIGKEVVLGYEQPTRKGF